MASTNDERAFIPGPVSLGSAFAELPGVDRRRTRSAMQDVAPGVDLLEMSAGRRHPWAAGGVCLVACAALLGAWLFAPPASTTSVVVAAADLAPGHIITQADLRIVDVGRSHGFRSVPAERRDALVGAAARALIPEGTLFHPDHVVAPGLAVPRGKVVVGAVLTPGALPVPALRPGDPVVVLAATAGGDGDDRHVFAGAAAIDGAEVWAVEDVTLPSTPGAVWVALLVDVADQTEVAHAAAADHLRLGLVAP